jgi:hypothetical protein
MQKTGTAAIYKAVSTPGTLKELHNAEFDDGICRQCHPTLTPIAQPWCCLAFEMWNSRAYTRVYENRLEQNTPLVFCCPMNMCMLDFVSVRFFDKGAKFVPWTRATACTPFHTCYMIECHGEVAATAKMACLNNCLFPCCRTYVPGLKDAQAFCDAANAAQATALAAVSNPATQKMG